MISNGPKLLISSGAGWSSLLARPAFGSGLLIIGALTAAIWPAMASVFGQMGAAMFGFSDHHLALQRGAVGFISALGGAVVMAPALTLAILLAGRSARVELSGARAGTAAMLLVWPVWTAGFLFLLVLPLIGLGPEVAEILWGAAAALILLRALKDGLARAIGVRRRWARTFEWRLALAFAGLFAVLVLFPSFFMRYFLGAATVYVPDTVTAWELPRPPEPNW